MDTVEVYETAGHRVTIACRDGVGVPTPYSLFLAEHIPALAGQTVVDLGTGSGFLAVVAKLQGAVRVYLLDTHPAAVAVALENAERNGVLDGLVPLSIGPSMIPLPAGERVDCIICNPAQLPLPEPERAHSPFYAGPDGRLMIEGLIREAPQRLAADGTLLMTHNSLADWRASERLMRSEGLEPHVLAERTLEFRPFIDRAWLDQLGGTGRGLYTVRNGLAYETLYVVQARLRSAGGPASSPRA